jgi:hypothetical protein
VSRFVARLASVMLTVSLSRARAQRLSAASASASASATATDVDGDHHRSRAVPRVPGGRGRLREPLRSEHPNTVHVETPAGTFVSVDRKYPRSGRFSAQVTQSVGQRFTFAVTTDATNDKTTVYNVRCLPTDFPTWSASKTGPTQAAF